jgi:hypothetical protein
VSTKSTFAYWLAEQTHREDEVGEYARAARVEHDGTIVVPTGMSDHARAAALEFAGVRDSRRTTPLFDVAHSHHIGPIALAKLLRRGLPHRRVDADYFADRNEVGVWLGEQHEPGMCGQWLAVLEGDAPTV